MIIIYYHFIMTRIWPHHSRLSSHTRRQRPRTTSKLSSENMPIDRFLFMGFMGTNQRAFMFSLTTTAGLLVHLPARTHGDRQHPVISFVYGGFQSIGRFHPHFRLKIQKCNNEITDRALAAGNRRLSNVCAAVLPPATILSAMRRQQKRKIPLRCSTHVHFCVGVGAADTWVAAPPVPANISEFLYSEMFEFLY